MKFLEVVKKLQEDKLNEGYVILIQNGIFFVGKGRTKKINQKTQNFV